MMTKAEVQRWLDTLPEDSSIAIDEGGLAIVEVDAKGDQTEAYLEIGMTPREEDMLHGGGDDEVGGQDRESYSDTQDRDNYSS